MFLEIFRFVPWVQQNLGRHWFTFPDRLVWAKSLRVEASRDMDPYMVPCVHILVGAYIVLKKNIWDIKAGYVSLKKKSWLCVVNLQ